MEVENGIVTFVQAHQRADNLAESVDQAWLALQVLVAQYQAGLSGIDFNRYATIEQTLITQQDQWAQSRGQICQGLIQVYRGLGGGWQIKCATPPVNTELGAAAATPELRDKSLPPVPPAVPYQEGGGRPSGEMLPPPEPIKPIQLQPGPGVSPDPTKSIDCSRRHCSAGKCGRPAGSAPRSAPVAGCSASDAVRPGTGSIGSVTRAVNSGRGTAKAALKLFLRISDLFCRPLGLILFSLPV